MDDFRGFGIDELAQASALPVAASINCDPSAPPPTGAQYLLRVKLEAKKLPDFMVRPPKRKGKNKHVKKAPLPQVRTIQQLLQERFAKADKEICPTIAWADETLRAFKRVRDKVNEARSLSNNPLSDHDIHKVPHVRNTAAWKKIILGDVDPLAALDGPQVVYDCEGGKGPFLSVIIQFPQGAVIDFIDTINGWVKELGWSHQAAVWSYSLLACLELPVAGDTIAVLRDLSRTCSIIRTKHKRIENKSLVTALNLIICIVGQFFGQLDICDDYLPKELEPVPSTSTKNAPSEANEPPKPPPDAATLDQQIEEIKERMRRLNEEFSPIKMPDS